MKTVAAGPRLTTCATLLSSILLMSCEKGSAPSSPARASGDAVQEVQGGPFAFVNFELGAAPGTICPGSPDCANGAAEPQLRADATGTFYVSSELGLGSGTLAWKSSDGGLHYTALESPNQLSQEAGGLAPGGGDTDLGVAPEANASGIPNVYVASLSLANVTVSTSQDGGKTWSKNVLSATIPGDDREWIAADQATKVCISYHDIFYSFSTNGGLTWTGPIQVNQAPSATAIMPWSVACNPGQLNIVWYGTSFYDGTTAPDNYPASAAWYVFFAQNLNAAMAGSTFTQAAATPIIHYGGVCESGVGCTGNRDLFDDFGIAVSPTTGAASITYSDDQPGNTGAADHTAIATQTVGPKICA